MALKPWFKVVTPREDLREGKPLDASEFAIHLDKVRTGNAPDDYRVPERFFDRTYLTKSLYELSAQVMRRLSGITTETSAVFMPTPGTDEDVIGSPMRITPDSLFTFA